MITTLEIVIPVFLLIAAGYILKRINLITDSGAATLKNVAVNLFLPPLAFNVLIHGQFTKSAFIMMATGIIVLAVAYFIGLFWKRFFDKSVSGYVPWSITTFEGGMFGWAMIAILVGDSNLFYIVPMDIMNGVFCFSIMSAGLKMLSGQTMSTSQKFKAVFTSPLIIAVILGFIGCAFNWGGIIEGSKFAGLYNKCISWLTGPLTPVILLTIGYGLVFDGKVLSKGIKLVILRVLTMAVLCVITISVLSLFVDMNRVLRVSLITYFFVPTSFVLPMYTKSKESIEFTSGYLSLQIIVSLVIFTVISILYQANIL